MKKPVTFSSLRATLRPRDLVDYWLLSQKIYALERKEGSSHYGCEIVTKVQRKLRDRFCTSLLRNIRPFRYWSKTEVISIRHMALRNAILLSQFDTNAAKLDVESKLKARIVNARRRLMARYPGSGQGKPKHAAIKAWLAAVRAKRESFGFPVNTDK